MTKRLFDIVFSLVLIVVLIIPIVVIALFVRLTSRGPAIHWSKRVGKNNQIFLMPKFRSMRIDTPQLATHLMTNPDTYLTPIGEFLRKTSLDELPQLFSVLRGDMSFVGPRPALYNQDDLVALRSEVGVEKLIPGITGWAQVNGRDDLPIPVKVGFDKYYLENQSLIFDIRIIWRTIFKIAKADGVHH